MSGGFLGRALLRRLRLALLPAAGQAVGLFLLVLVLAAAAVSAPRMVADAEQAAWEQQRDRLSPTSLGGSFGSSTLADDATPTSQRALRVADLDSALTAEAVDLGLPDPLLRTSLWRPTAATGPAGSAAVQLVSRDGAADNVAIVAGASSDTGVLAPVALAEDLGIAPGDTITLQDRFGPATVEVSGLYETPTAPVGRYWDGQGFLFLPTRSPTGDLVHPPAALLAPQAVALATAAELEADLALVWFFPLPDGASVDDARTAAADVDALQARTTNPGSPVLTIVQESGFQLLVPNTALPAVLGLVDRTVELLSPPVRAVGIGGATAAIVLVGAWAGLRARRREDELRVLIARGSSPARFAGRAAAEAALPGLAGLVLGAGAGVLLVDGLGPAAVPPALDAAALGGPLVAGGLAALTALGVVTAVYARRLERVESGRGGALAARVPWLAVTAAVTVVAALPLFAADADDEQGIGILPLLVPLLATVVAGGAATGLLARAGRRSDAMLHRLPTGPFLAARRVIAGPGAVRLVVVTTALTLGLVVFAGALGESTTRTIAAKASVAIGSDVVVALGPGNTLEGSGPLPDGAMVVGNEGAGRLRPGGGQVDVLVVPPDEVADVVSWDGTLAQRPVEDLMAALADYGGDRVPVIAAGPLPDDLLEATDGEVTVDFRYFAVAVEVVGRAEAFPGQGSRRPLLVADRDSYVAALDAADRDADLLLAREVWATGTASEVLADLADAGYGPFDAGDVRTAAEFADRPELSAQTWSLDYLRAVALAAGVLGLVGVGMYAVAQQRRRTVAALLLARMGMSRRAADGTTGLEIGLITGVAGLVAVAVALPASALVLRTLDPVPSLPPDPMFAVPWDSLAAVLAGVVALTGAASVLVGRAARRETGGQVLRDAD